MQGFRCFGCHQIFPTALALDSHQFRPGTNRCRLYWLPRRLPAPLAPDLGGSRMWRFLLNWEPPKRLRKRGPAPPLNPNSQFQDVERWILWNGLKCSRARTLVAHALVTHSPSALTMLDMRGEILRRHSILLSRITIYVALKEFANAGVIRWEGTYHRPDTLKRGPKPKSQRVEKVRRPPRATMGLGMPPPPLE